MVKYAMITEIFKSLGPPDPTQPHLPQNIELFLLFDSTIGTYLMEICTEIAGNYLFVWLFHILYMWCRQLKFQTIDKTIGALETYSIMEYELFFATLPLSWFQILLTVESPAQVLIICALCHAHPAHQTKHSPVLWRKALCTIVEAGLGMGGSEVHREDNILWKPVLDNNFLKQPAMRFTGWSLSLR